MHRWARVPGRYVAGVSVWLCVCVCVCVQVALREIRKYQASTDLLLPKAPFARVVREIVHDVDRTGEAYSLHTTC